MSEVVVFLILLTEILTVLECLQIAFKQELKFDRYMAGIILIDLVIYTGINMKFIPMICSVLFFLLVFVYCYFKFKQTIAKTLVRFIVGLSLMGCIEGIASIIMNLVVNANNSISILFLSSLFVWLFTHILKKKISLVGDKKIVKVDKGMFGIVIFYALSFVGLFVDYYFNQGLVNIYVVVILTFLVFGFVYIYRLEQAQNEIEKKNYELQVQQIYGGAYEKLLTEVRRKQHDYKNQLGALYSMHLTAKSFEELVDMQKEYGNALQSDCKFDSILTCCDNSVLAGYIYYRCISCEKEGIAIDYDIHLEQAECCFALHEIIEILGILIDNACENFATVQTDDKRIGLEFQEDKEKIIFKVSNPANYASFSEIDKMFTYGYSSKGENRGIGLARVFELVKKYAAEIKVLNCLNNEENWINFTLEIAK